MLDYSTYVPTVPKDGATVLLLLHGRGSDKHDLLGLQPWLDQDAIIVTPRGPFPGAAWGYGDGYAWYRYLGGTTPESASLERSIAELTELVEVLPSILPVAPGPIVTGGFSQGSTTALAFALINRPKIAANLMFSGFLASHPAVEAALPNAAGLPVFWGHGTADPMIPFDFGVAGRRQLGEAGAIVEARDYPMGHEISPRELADAKSWLEKITRTSGVVE
jgi:phospholipase/carboxylesterase